MVANLTIDDVREYWDRQPCNIRHSDKTVGTIEYFEEVTARKYFVEPHIPLFAQFDRWAGRRVLEIGCGIGTDTLMFAQRGAEVTAVDVSATSLDLARRRAVLYGVEDRVHFVQANAEELSEVLPPEPYDLIYSFGVIHHTLSPARVVAELRKYAASGTTLKIMIYHKYAWKVLWILLTNGRGRFWTLDRLVAQYSEAQTGCPVTYVYSRAQARALVEAAGFRTTDLFVDHIFPYRVQDYTKYRYVKQWYFRCLPGRVFRQLEQVFGWHICLTAKAF